MKTSVKQYVICALCIAVICVLAPIAVPVGPVPVSLATFAIMFAGFLLGSKWGTVASVIYLIIGLVGIPVFAGYSAGLARIAGPTGGYLIGYIALAFICGYAYDRFGRGQTKAKRYVPMAVGAIVGTIVLYAIGTAWFCIQSNTGVIPALGLCVFPFLLGDAIKIVAVCLVVPNLEKALRKAGVRVI